MSHDCMIGKPGAMDRFEEMAAGLTAKIVADYQGHCQKELSNIIVLAVCNLGDLFERDNRGAGLEFVKKIGDALMRSAELGLQPDEFHPPAGTTLQ